MGQDVMTFTANNRRRNRAAGCRTSAGSWSARAHGRLEVIRRLELPKKASSPQLSIVLGGLSDFWRSFNGFLKVQTCGALVRAHRMDVLRATQTICTSMNHPQIKHVAERGHLRPPFWQAVVPVRTYFSHMTQNCAKQKKCVS